MEKTEIEKIYEDIVFSLSSFKVLEENKIKDYNSKVIKLNKELEYFGKHNDKLSELNWFNETVKFNEIRNNVIELYRLLNKQKYSRHDLYESFKAGYFAYYYEVSCSDWGDAEQNCKDAFEEYLLNLNIK